MYTTESIWACVDCTLAAAGFSEEETGNVYPDETVKAIADLGDQIGEHRLIVEDDEIGFTWDRCELCWRDEGGSRRRITILARASN